MEDATRKDKCRSSFRRLRRRPRQPVAEWVNVFEKAVLDREAEGLNVELESMGWHLFEKSNLTLQRQERVLGAGEGKFEFATIRGALIKLFPDTTIVKKKSSVPDRKPSHVSNRQPNERSKNRFRKPRQGVTRPTKLMHVTQRMRKKQT